MGLMLRELLQIAENRLALSGCMDPRRDGELLLLFLLRADRSYLFAHGASVLDDDRCDMFFSLLDRRADGEPVQYIVGTQDFMGLTFQVDPRVLIPRQDTELLAETAIFELKQKKKMVGALRLLDLCCGSGALAVSIACNVPKLEITASDVSGDALEVAKKNAAAHANSREIEFIKSDLFDAFPKNKKGEGRKKFDVIVSNPPYIKTDVLPTLQKEVAVYEPRLALDGGESGLNFYRRILEEVQAFLAKDGVLLLEIGYDQAADVTELAQTLCGFQTEVRRDLAGHDRVIVCRAGKD